MKQLNLIILWFVLIQSGMAQTDDQNKFHTYLTVGNLLNKVGFTIQKEQTNKTIIGDEIAYYFDLFPGFKNTLYMNLNISSAENPKYIQFSYLTGYHDMSPYYFRYQLIPKSASDLKLNIGGSFSYIEPGNLFHKKVLYQVNIQYYRPTSAPILKDPGHSQWPGINRNFLWNTTFAGALAYFQIKWQIN